MDILLNFSKHITFLTGAGISTGVGIPDFRGNGTSSETRPDFSKFSPGIVHKYISDMTNTNKVQYVLTQNIDDLHRDITTDKLTELHGNVKKKTLVDFNTSLHVKDINKAYSILEKTDLLIIMGTSLMVSPVNKFPTIVLNNGGNVVIINKDPTDLDDRAGLVYRHDVEDVLCDMKGIFDGKTSYLEPTIIRGFPNGHVNTCKQWDCNICTYTNRFTKLSCEICKSPSKTV